MRRWLLFLAIFAVGCTTFHAPVLTLTYRNPEVDFNNYKSYAVIPPSGENDSNSLLWEGFMNQIRTEMQAKGYKELKEPGGADIWILIDYSTSFQNRYEPVQPKLETGAENKVPEIKFEGEHLYAHLALRFYDQKLREYTWQSITYMDSTDKLNTKSWNTAVISKLMNACPYSATYGGVGMRFDLQMEVTGMFAGSPAQESGILVGDKIQAVNGIDIRDYQQCVNMLKGEAGTKFKIVVKRANKADAETGGESKPLEFTLQRVPVNNFYLNRK